WVAPAVVNCSGPIVLTVVTNGSTVCWYSQGYHGINPNWTTVTYVHADSNANTHGWFLIYLAGVGGRFYNFYPGLTFTFGSSTFPNKITQVCLVCSPHS